MKRGNKGYTLIELLIILSIMAVAGGYLLFNSAAIFQYNAKECYKKINSILSSTKITTLSKSQYTGDYYIDIYKKSDSDGGYYYVDTYKGGDKDNLSATPGTRVDSVKVGAPRVKVAYVNGTDSKFIDSTNHLKLYFDRSSGAIGGLYGDHDAVPSDKFSIVVLSSRKNYTIDLYPMTGKIGNK